MLQVNNLSSKLSDISSNILNEISISLEDGSMHLLLGPNGAGKSTLLKSIMNWPTLKIEGEVIINDEDISKLALNERAQKGIFLAHQTPVEIPGVHTIEFLRSAYNSMRDEDNHMDPWSFKDLYDAISGSLGFSEDDSNRSLNEGYSGGEKRKSEILQMLLLRPQYALLDEIDSGLDIDTLHLIFAKVNEFVKENNSGVLIVSHNRNILDYISPDKVSVLKKGTIVQTGDVELAKEVLINGYSKY
jgi:Fe-S cluster assembly ATP-binding protein